MSDDAASADDFGYDRGRSRALIVLLAIVAAISFAGLTAALAELLRPLVGERAAFVRPMPVAALVAMPAPGRRTPNLLPPAPAPASAAAPRIAILFTDVGADGTAAKAAISSLPAAIGFAFSPYPDGVRRLADAARAAGHEVWAGVPMQPKTWPRVSPGANTLLVAAPAGDNRRRLDWALGRIGPVAGVTGIMGSAFTESAAALDPVLAALKPRGVAYVDSRVSPRSVALARARAAGVPAATNDRFLDGGALPANLAELEKAAHANGAALGFVRPTPAAIAAIAAWTKTLDGKGLTLVAPATLAK